MSPVTGVSGWDRLLHDSTAVSFSKQLRPDWWVFIHMWLYHHMTRDDFGDTPVQSIALLSHFSHRFAPCICMDLSTKRANRGMKNSALVSPHSCRSVKECAHLHPPPHLSLLFCSYGDRVEHFRVLEGAGQYCIWDETFCSLNRLVDFYRTHSIAMEKVVYLRDPPLPPRLLPQPGRNPYPNPYKSCSQESLLSAHLYSHPAHPSHPTRECSTRLLEAIVGVWQIMKS